MLGGDRWALASRSSQAGVEQEVGVGGAREGCLEEGALSRAWKFEEEDHSFRSLPGLRAVRYGRAKCGDEA